ncbi:hypothetical protein [Bradyrhizobium sp. SZCCHNR1093]|uniref:hypothetical protein n=1 Tax=Bradyrhizobium sp. SZCCHNR1093 TaxID=3057368 RepID=UPI0028EC0237|nr:hypothetical protein [Bradyrhizobium sp. SZCCHNR1093]
MQPLSRVKPSCATEWGSNSVMLKRPNVGIRTAQYIAEWSEIESLLGLFLAMLLHANQKAVLAIWSGLENRSAQLRTISSAARATLTEDHFHVVEAIMKIDIRSSMKYRDKLAHWSWGYSDQLEDALLIREPADKLTNMTHFVNLQQSSQVLSRDIPINFDTIYVITQSDLDRALTKLDTVQQRLLTLHGTIWERNDTKVRADLLNQLKEIPEIRAAINNQAASHGNP